MKDALLTTKDIYEETEALRVDINDLSEQSSRTRCWCCIRIHWEYLLPKKDSHEKKQQAKEEKQKSVKKMWKHQIESTWERLIQEVDADTCIC